MVPALVFGPEALAAVVVAGAGACNGFFNTPALRVVAVGFRGDEGAGVVALYLAELFQGVVGVGAGDGAAAGGLAFVDEVAVVVVLKTGDFAAGI